MTKHSLQLLFVSHPRQLNLIRPVIKQLGLRDFRLLQRFRVVRHIKEILWTA